MSYSHWHLIRAPKQPRPDGWRELPQPLLAGGDDPSAYLADAALLDAANVAIELGQPLLLMGPPGCGKTSFAHHVAWQLGMGRALVHSCSTNMETRDLYYGYDDLGRFRAAQAGECVDAARFLTLNALGRAILMASDPVRFGPLRERLGLGTQQYRSVILLDEIDKAPRDVPNDLLGLINAERLWFRIQELEGYDGAMVTVEAAPAFLPILICTSNSEKSLPDPFLRRCIFHDIAAPTGEALRQIVESRVTPFRRDDPLVKDAQKLIDHLCDQPRLRKRPGTSELLGFLLALKARGYTGDRRLTLNDKDIRALARVTLLKAQDDQTMAGEWFDTIDKA